MSAFPLSQLNYGRGQVRPEDRAMDAYNKYLASVERRRQGRATNRQVGAAKAAETKAAKSLAAKAAAERRKLAEQARQFDARLGLDVQKANEQSLQFGDDFDLRQAALRQQAAEAQAMQQFRQAGLAEDARRTNIQAQQQDRSMSDAMARFQQGLGLDRQKMGQQNDQFYAGQLANMQNEDLRRLAAQRQFDAGQGLTREQMAQSQGQFEDTMGFNREKMAQAGQQFEDTMDFNRDRAGMADRLSRDQMGQANEQFYAGQEAMDHRLGLGAQYADRSAVLRSKLGTESQERLLRFQRQMELEQQDAKGKQLAEATLAESVARMSQEAEAGQAQMNQLIQSGSHSLDPSAAGRIRDINRKLETLRTARIRPAQRAKATSQLLKELNHAMKNGLVKNPTIDDAMKGMRPVDPTDETGARMYLNQRTGEIDVINPAGDSTKGRARLAAFAEIKSRLDGIRQAAADGRKAELSSGDPDAPVNADEVNARWRRYEIEERAKEIEDYNRNAPEDMQYKPGPEVQAVIEQREQQRREQMTPRAYWSRPWSHRHKPPVGGAPVEQMRQPGESRSAVGRDDRVQTPSESRPYFETQRKDVSEAAQKADSHPVIQQAIQNRPVEAKQLLTLFKKLASLPDPTQEDVVKLGEISQALKVMAASTPQSGPLRGFRDQTPGW